MSKSNIIADQIIELIKTGNSVEEIRAKYSFDSNDWARYSAKAYNKNLQNAKKERDSLQGKKNVSATSNKDIAEILKINEELANHALILPIFSTLGELANIKDLYLNLPSTEEQIFNIFEKVTMAPRLRMLQKRGRLEQFEYFKLFSRMIDAAVLCFYRNNFVSCYLTLVPIIEGVIIRWMGFVENTDKPDFEDIRNFFKKSAARQPCPTNILFHNIYTKACDKILNEHFYKPTPKGSSYANFNRHVASHLLNSEQFATRENCLRLFILLDTMTEIYFCESLENDPRFAVSREEISNDINTLIQILVDTRKSPENHFLNY
ncbi:MAG: hypothetical protein ACN6N7_08930 [Chryseobacterium culicis]